MVKRLVAFAVVGAGLAACTNSRDAVSPTQSGSSGQPAPNADVQAGLDVSNRYIIVFRDDVADVAGTARALAAAHNTTLRHTYQYALHGFAAEFSPAAVEDLRNDPRVDYIEADQIARIVDTQLNPGSWGLDRVDQRNLPLDNSYTYPGGGGAGAHVYIIDTGIRTTHIDFGGRATFDVNTNSDGLTIDCNGHGTHVSGTTGGSTYGIAKQVRLHAVRVLNCLGSGSYSDVIAGVDWVTANHQSPAAANMSLGGPPSTALDQAVVNSINAGVFYAIAAGNSGYSACNDSPARVTQAYTVGATSITDARASFSNFGSCLDIFAPGVNIVSDYNTNDSATAVLSGTSMAAPHVAGSAALYLAANPSATPSQVASALTSNATSGVVTNPGTGSPNLLLYMAFISAPGNQPPVASFTYSCSDLTCSFNGLGSTDDGGIASWSWTFGDATTGSGPTPSHTYAAGGTYSVTLTVTDSLGLTGSQTQNVTVTDPNSQPIARFTFTCTGLTCSFDMRSSTVPNGVQTNSWDFGDGSTATRAATPSHTYAAAGTYNVRMVVTDKQGLSDDTTQAVTVTGGSPVVARFTFTCTGRTCTFDGRTSSSPNGIANLIWDFGDGSTANRVIAPTHTYATGGTFTVKLTAVDRLGFTDDEIKPVTVP